MQSLIIAGLSIVVGLFLLYIIVGPVVIDSDEVGLVEKKYSTKTLKNGDFIALNGESGIQPDLLRAGLHFKCKIFYKVHKMPLITIKQSQMGYIFARSGKSLNSGQVLAKEVESNDFQDVRLFLENGGQKGPQRAMLREGSYAINLAQFVVLTQDAIHLLPMGDRREIDEIKKMKELLVKRNGFKPIIISNEPTVERSIDGEIVHLHQNKDTMGIVITYEGRSLPQDDIIAPIVGQDPDNDETYHNSFQNIEKFLKAGGYQGRQYQVLTEGIYIINRLFASVEFTEKTFIDNSEAGVVISYTGERGEDLSGESFTNGELVENGCKGIWRNPLMPGKYAFNNYAGKIIKVPTDNFSLKWVDNQTSEYNYDKNLRCLSVITNDGFQPKLPLSVLVHIDYTKAPLVIQRFGSIEKLVEQTLDTIISAHFKQIAESKTFLELVQNKAEIGREAKEKMAYEFKKFNLDLEEVLIDTPLSNGDKRIEALIEQLAERQIAKEQVKTNEAKKDASLKERELKELQAKTNEQEELTKSSIAIQVTENKAEAERKKAEKDAEKAKIDADAKFYKDKKEVELGAFKTEKQAEAEAKKLKVSAEAEANTKKIIAQAESKSIKDVAEAEAYREREVGSAKAEANQKLVDSYGGADLLVKKETAIAFAKAIEEGKIDIVPKNLITNGTGSQGNALENILNLVLLDKFDKGVSDESSDMLKEAVGLYEQEKEKNKDK